ncbi:MAG: hypothetical protein LBF43_02735 [Puniceicoccales bacterium]|nr:hypothetical protein [Puniceicoccales bacterium]
MLGEVQQGVKYKPVQIEKTLLEDMQQNPLRNLLGAKITFNIDPQNLLQQQKDNIDHDIACVERWLSGIPHCSPKQQGKLCAGLGERINGSPYQPEILALLNQHATNNPQIAATRDAYAGKHSEHITGEFCQKLSAVLTEPTQETQVTPMQAKLAFIEQFNGAQSLENKSATQIRNEQAAIESLLKKDDLTPSNRVFLQQLSLAYEIKLNENNPKKMVELASQFAEQEVPFLRQMVQVAQNISQTNTMSEAQKQRILDAQDITDISARICDAMFPRTMEAVKMPKFKTKGDAYLKIYGNHVTQGVMRFNSLMQEMVKKTLASDPETVKRVGDELKGYINLFSSNTALYTARVEEASTKELQSFNTTGLINANDGSFAEFDKQHSLDILKGFSTKTLQSLVERGQELSKQPKANTTEFRKSFEVVLRYAPLPEDQRERQQMFGILTQGIQCFPQKMQKELGSILQSRITPSA